MHESAEERIEPGQKRSIWIGRQGLRAGWGCLIFLLVVVLLEWAVNTLLAAALRALHLPVHPKQPVGPGFLLLGEGISAAVVLLATLVMLRIEKRPLASYGLGGRALLSRLAGGLVAGFAAISALVGILWATHALSLQGPVLSAGSALRYGLGWAVAFAMVACFEELLLRGYLLFTLRRGLGFWWGALILSATFGAIHGMNPGETPVGLFAAAAVGLVFCVSIWYTGSLWWAIGAHAAWDWGESFFWGTSDSGMGAKGALFNAQPMGHVLLSGGKTGPEGSVWVFAVLVLLAAGMFAWWRGKGTALAKHV